MRSDEGGIVRSVLAEMGRGHGAPCPLFHLITGNYQKLCRAKFTTETTEKYEWGMNMVPSRLTRQQMETRRFKGAQLLKEGQMSQAEIARRLGVTRAAVGHWARQLRSGGLRSLRQRKHQGRPFRLRPSQRRRLSRLLLRGALTAGFETDRWTLTRVHQVILREFGVRYHPKYIGRLLRRLGWQFRMPSLGDDAPAGAWALQR